MTLKVERKTYQASHEKKAHKQNMRKENLPKQSQQKHKSWHRLYKVIEEFQIFDERKSSCYLKMKYLTLQYQTVALYIVIVTADFCWLNSSLVLRIDIDHLMYFFLQTNTPQEIQKLCLTFKSLMYRHWIHRPF